MARLKAAVAKETGWTMAAARFVHVTEIAQVQAALRGRHVSRVVWVGHVIELVHNRRGMLSLERGGGSIEGDEFARMLPEEAEVALLGCDSRAITAQMKAASPKLEIRPSKGDRQINIEYDHNLAQTVRKVWFSPWVYE